jgi:hypothetical protein
MSYIFLSYGFCYVLRPKADACQGQTFGYGRRCKLCLWPNTAFVVLQTAIKLAIIQLIFFAEHSPLGDTDQDRRLRREIEHSNERRHMQSINAGFQTLRKLLPHHEGEQLSKAVILQQIAEHISRLKQEESLLREKNSVLKRLYSLAQQNSEETYHLKQEKTQLILLYGNLSQQSLTFPSLGNSGVQTGFAKMIDEDEGRELVPGELTGREIANYKERRRMQCFEKLRPLLPLHEGEKLGKVAILQQTAEYIHQLEREKARLLLQNKQLDRLFRMANPNRLYEQDLTSASSGNSAEQAESSMSPRIEKKGLVCFFDHYLVTTHL